jgi:hypothetical protein
MTADESDPILDRLSEVDPARQGGGDEALVRANVKRRAEEVLGRPDPPRRSRRTGLLVAGGAGLAAAVLAIVFAGGGDGLSPGPERALAIEKGPNGVTLTIEDADASAQEMNDELADAGIDNVRVFSVPGSPNHAGRWGGTISLSANCEGAPNRLGYGVRFSRHTIDAPAAPGRDFVDIDLPLAKSLNSRQAISGGVGTMSGAGKRAVVSTRTADGSTYAPAVLIAIRARGDGDPPDAKTFGVDDLAALGGDFEPYAQALSDGHADCEELGLEPPLPDSASAADENADRLLEDGPVLPRCVIKVLGTGLFSIEGEVTAEDARRIHVCSDRIGDAARREHEELRERREQEVERVDSVADLPAFVRARLDPNRSTPRARHGGVNPNKQGTDTGAVVLTDYDGHDHRTPPKRPGQYVNLDCAARGGEDREFWATTFFEGEPVANARVSCRAHGPGRSTHVVKLSELGVYEIHLNGAGFDDFIIRTRSTESGGRHPNIMRPPDRG